MKDDIDVGLALRNGTEVQVDVFSGTSVLNPGQSTGKVEIIHKIFSPLAANEVGTIRCILTCQMDATDYLHNLHLV